MAQGVGPDFKPQYHKNKQTNKQKKNLWVSESLSNFPKARK
jgi:hypothetical protein